MQCNFLLLALNAWRDAVSRSHTAAQLAMALYVLESCVAWDKSIMKAVSVYFVVYRCHIIRNFTLDLYTSINTINATDQQVQFVSFCTANEYLPADANTKHLVV